MLIGYIVTPKHIFYTCMTRSLHVWHAYYMYDTPITVSCKFAPTSVCKWFKKKMSWTRTYPRIHAFSEEQWCVPFVSCIYNYITVVKHNCHTSIVVLTSLFYEKKKYTVTCVFRILEYNFDLHISFQFKVQRSLHI